MQASSSPPPLTAAASLVAVQGLVLVAVAIVEILDVEPGRAQLAVSTSVFFTAYGLALLGCAFGLTRQAAWTRGPVLISQLIQLGLAWNLREYALVAIVLALAALLVIAGMLHPDSIEALADRPED